ncbi:MAG: hypothetical protein Q4B70_00720 [Lachnospiraceae bacterium]|nr:hypothetical protein [Lachnospiraceae bacterium]
MQDNSVKSRIDSELEHLKLTDSMKRNIGNRKYRKSVNMRRFTKIVAAFAVVFILSGVTVFAARYLINRVNVNNETLPDLDSMYAVDANLISGEPDEYGVLEKTKNSYKEVKNELGISLLDSDLAVENPYMRVNIQTDNQNYCILTISNYILGDTSNYQFVEDYNHYNCDPGEEYKSTITLQEDIILSKEQEETEWSTDYLGYYQYVESYISAQGYKVNIVEDTLVDDDTFSGVVSEKCAIFVSDGVRYTLRGRISLETLKELVDSMK